MDIVLSSTNACSQEVGDGVWRHYWHYFGGTISPIDMDSLLYRKCIASLISGAGINGLTKMWAGFWKGLILSAAQQSAWILRLCGYWSAGRGKGQCVGSEGRILYLTVPKMENGAANCGAPFVCINSY